MKRTQLATTIAAAFLPALASADLSALDVQFSPNAVIFDQGTVVDVTATGNGSGMEYAFEIVKSTGYRPIQVRKPVWSSANTAQIDTSTGNLASGDFLLRVYSRESTNRPETLIKTERFTVASQGSNACGVVNGKTYTNAAPTSPVIDLGCPGGFLCLGLLSTFSTGFSFDTSSGASHIDSVRFQDGVATLALEPVQVTSSLGSGTITPVGALTGTYSCSATTVTIDTAGSGGLAGAAGLTSLLNGASIPLSMSGNLTLDKTTGNLTAGGAELH